MDTCSYFIENKALFGSMPSTKNIRELEKAGVVYFVNLASHREKKMYEYDTNYYTIHFPIPDRKVPKDVFSFCVFIYSIFFIIKSLKENERLYVHCKGGHGRSGIVVACLLCLYYKIPPECALDLTNYYHKQRKIMREKWRKIGSPQTDVQKQFVKDLFEPIYFNSRINAFLSSSYSCALRHPHFEKPFCNVESLYQAFKNENDKKYIDKLQTTTSLREIKKLGKNVCLRSDWENVKDEIMYQIQKLKFDSHPELKIKLLSTCFQPIVFHGNENTYWKDNKENRLGKLLQKIRNEYFFEYFLLQK